MTIHLSLTRGLCLAVLLAIASAIPAAGQDTEKAPVVTPKPPESKGPYVRKFSMGANFSFLAQPSIPSASETQTVSDELSIESTTTSKRRPFGGGIVLQTTVTPHFAIATGVLFRMLDFSTRAITYEGVDDTDTAYVDERTASLKEDSTRARLLDVPLLLRYYNRDHSRRGRRYFYEGGTALRFVHSIHSFGMTTSQAGTETCCDETSLKPANRVVPGLVVGGGMQFIDDFGIRFVPEIRYTHWLGRTFDSRPARSGTDQIEFGISVTF